MELRVALFSTLVFLYATPASACPVPENLEMLDVLVATDAEVVALAKTPRPLATCVDTDARADELRTARIIAETRLAANRDLEELQRISEKASAHPRAEKLAWRVLVVRIRAARGQRAFATLESLYSAGALDAEPEALNLLAKERRLAGDVKGAGKIAVEARAARERTLRARARLLAKQLATHIRTKAE